MNIVIIIATILISLAIGALVGMAYRKKVAESKIQGAENEAKRLIDLAKIEAENMKKEEIFKAKKRGKGIAKFPPRHFRIFFGTGMNRP